MKALSKAWATVPSCRSKAKTMVPIREIPEIRMYELERISQALASRKPGSVAKDEKLMVIACDHSARGALAAGMDEDC